MRILAAWGTRGAAGRDDRSREAEPCDFFIVNKAGTGARVGCVRTGELVIVAHLVLPAHVPGRDLPGSRLAGAWLFGGCSEL
jgi:hypothetical protein